MALFGVAEVDAAYLVRHGTAHAEVAVTLGDAEHVYAVRRRFRRVRRRGRESFEPERLTYAEDGRLAAYSATEIRQRVIDLLGFPDNPNPHAHSDLWRWAIYVPQERMREILAADPEERLQTVRKALGVERYRTAAENAQALVADLKVAVRRRREEAARLAHWDTEFADASREADRLRAERVALAAAVGEADATLGVARKRREEQEARAARSEADRRELEGLEREDEGDVRALEGTLRRRHEVDGELARTRQEAEALAPLGKELAGLRDARRAAEATVRDRRADLDQHAEELRSLARATTSGEAAERRARDADERLRAAGAERDGAKKALDEAEVSGPTREPPAPTSRSLGEIEEELRTAVASEHASLDQLSRAEASLGQIDELLRGGVCPTCHQTVRSEEFSAHRAEVAGNAEAARHARDTRAEARMRLEEERKARERYERAHERWQELSRRRTEAAVLLGERDETVRTAGAAHAEAEAELARARAELERLRPVEAAGQRQREALDAAERRLRDVVGAEQRALQAQERLRGLEAIDRQLGEERSRLAGDAERLGERRTGRTARLAGLRADLADAAGIAQALEAERARERERERARADAEQALVRADTRLDAVVLRQGTAERGRAERAELTREASDLEAKAAWVAEPFRLAVLRMEKELLAHAQVTFDRAFARFFASLIDDPSLAARTDASFTPEVTVAGEPTPAEALSGGERTSLALALRLALAGVVRSLGAVRLETLLLDEPTDGFSGEQVVRMGELLEELALPQVVVVSHESQLTGIADRTVRVVKVDGSSTIRADERASAAEPVAAGPEAEPPVNPPPTIPTQRRTR